MTKDLTEENFQELVEQGDVLVDVWGPGCVPCMALMPFLETLETEYEGRISVLKLNAPDNRKLCRDLRVAGLPAYVTMRDGVEVERVTGGQANQQNIRAAVERLLAGAPARGLPVPEHLR
jgi:thioredoxin-like negative regulator of GroEL